MNKNRYEAWTSNNPSLVHLMVFGCEAFMHVPKKKIIKLDRKSKKCIFIGYKDGVKGYKLWNMVTIKIIYSRDVILEKLKVLPRINMLKGKRNKKI